jgi:hypothetical protein
MNLFGQSALEKWLVLNRPRRSMRTSEDFWAKVSVEMWPKIPGLFMEEVSLIKIAKI